MSITPEQLRSSLALHLEENPNYTKLQQLNIKSHFQNDQIITQFMNSPALTAFTEDNFLDDKEWEEIIKLNPQLLQPSSQLDQDNSLLSMPIHDWPNYLDNLPAPQDEHYCLNQKALAERVNAFGEKHDLDQDMRFTLLFILAAGDKKMQHLLDNSSHEIDRLLEHTLFEIQSKEAHDSDFELIQPEPENISGKRPDQEAIVSEKPADPEKKVSQPIDLKDDPKPQPKQTSNMNTQRSPQSLAKHQETMRAIWGADNQAGSTILGGGHIAKLHEELCDAFKAVGSRDDCAKDEQRIDSPENFHPNTPTPLSMKPDLPK